MKRLIIFALVALLAGAGLASSRIFASSARGDAVAVACDEDDPPAEPEVPPLPPEDDPPMPPEDPTPTPEEPIPPMPEDPVPPTPDPIPDPVPPTPDPIPDPLPDPIPDPLPDPIPDPLPDPVDPIPLPPPPMINADLGAVSLIVHKVGASWRVKAIIKNFGPDT